MAIRVARGLWILVSLLVLVLVLVPGDTDEFEFYAYEKAVIRHGWPWTYCTREARCPNWRLGDTPLGPASSRRTPHEFPLAAHGATEQAAWVQYLCNTIQNPASLYIPAWVFLTEIYDTAWSPARLVRDFSWLWLVADFVALSALLAAIYAGGAWLFAQRRGWSITLRGWLVGCSLLSVAGGWGIIEYRRDQRERTMATELDNRLCECDFSGGWLPDWAIAHVSQYTLDRRILFAGGRVECVRISSYLEPEHFRSAIETTTRLPGLRMLVFLDQSTSNPVPLEAICQMQELEVLNLDQNSLPLESLLRLASLKKLRVIRTWGRLPSDEELRVLHAAMPHVRFEDVLGSE